MMLRRICVFCGASKGNNASYEAAARRLGRELADRGTGLVFGGSNIGLMGALADAAKDAGGYVIGVIPQALVEKEVAHKGLSDLRIVSSMHERKAMMAELSDAFVALPGGFGTFEEWFEVVTWSQLGLHTKPCFLLNIEGYYDRFLDMIAHAEKEGFLPRGYRHYVRSARSVADLFEQLDHWHPVQGERYLTRSDT